MLPSIDSSVCTLFLFASLVFSSTRLVDGFAGISRLSASSTSLSHDKSLVPTTSSALFMDSSLFMEIQLKKDLMASTPKKVESPSDWRDLLESSDNKITLVWFKASFCKTCKAFGRQWKQKVLPLAASQSSKLQLATVDFQENRSLFHELDIKSLPTVQFYFKGKLLTSYSITPHDFDRLEKSLDFYLNGASTAELEYEVNMESRRKSFKNELSAAIKLKKSKSLATTTTAAVGPQAVPAMGRSFA